MGQGASGMPGAPGGGPPGGPGGNKKDEQKKKKKFEPRPPMRTGKKKRKKGPSAAVRTPQGGLCDSGKTQHLLACVDNVNVPTVLYCLLCQNRVQVAGRVLLYQATWERPGSGCGASRPRCLDTR